MSRTTTGGVWPCTAWEGVAERPCRPTTAQVRSLGRCRGVWGRRWELTYRTSVSEEDGRAYAHDDDTL
eukprot:3899767-Pyramimonas_sp.AAC.1